MSAFEPFPVHVLRFHEPAGPVACVTFLSPEEILGIGGLPNAGFVGMLVDPEGGLRPDNFAQNPGFMEFLHDIIAGVAPQIGELARIAAQLGSGTIGIHDGRGAQPGTAPKSGTALGVFQVRDGRLSEDGYFPDKQYPLFTERGMFLVHPEIREWILIALRRLTWPRTTRPGQSVQRLGPGDDRHAVVKEDFAWVERHDALFGRAAGLAGPHLLVQERRPSGSPGYFVRRKLSKAATLLEEVLALNPTNLPAHALLGKIAQRFGDVEEALRRFTDALVVAPSERLSAMEAGAAAIRLGRFDEGIRLMELPALIHPTTAGLRQNLGVCYLLCGRVEDALRELASASSLLPDDAPLARMHALARAVHTGRQRCPRTLPALEEALGAPPA